jgi:hypothetical protein
VALEQIDGLLRADFEVRGPVRANPELPVGESQWGLWDWDVVEVFVAPGGLARRLPYYEFQASPLGQHFELEVLEPRRRVNRDFRSGLRAGATQFPGGWRAWLEIPLAALGYTGMPLIGGCFSITGPTGGREYRSLFQAPTAHPDFHLPDQFQLFK